MKDHKLFVSVDMDEWYLARWATGSENSIWSSPEDVFAKLYQSDKPIGEILPPTDRILELFDRLNFKSTFFFTGYIANLYPKLVKRIIKEGHEIACHNYHHLDYEYEDVAIFKKDLSESKKLLQDLSGQEILGYRSPNSSVPSCLVEALEENGFKYDSSVTPTRKIFGKFGDFTKAPSVPYHPSSKDIAVEGNSPIWEIPWATFPYLKFPAGSGIMHRIGGNLYNNIATNSSLKKGATSYYFHPYELAELKCDFEKNTKIKIFLRNLGDNYFNSLEYFLTKHKEKLINGADLIDKLNKE